MAKTTNVANAYCIGIGGYLQFTNYFFVNAVLQKKRCVISEYKTDLVNVYF